jgi:GTP-binding protein
VNQGVIAIVGRPNVGKSTIFNRIAGARVSIVEDVPGVTRDRIYARAEWTGHSFRLIDTGGIQLADQPYQKEIQAQVSIALEEADVIIFVVNGKFGLTDDDKYIARMLQKSSKPVVLAVNQIDDESRLANIYEFYALGVGDPIAVSGVHGIGIGDLLDACVAKFPEEEAHDESEGLRIAVIGEPNVGK